MKTNIDTLDQYLGVVAAFLPKAERGDIVAELASNILAELEEGGTNWPPSEAAVTAILERYGEPGAVAAKYRANTGSLTLGRRAIGPEIWPLYVRFLWINLGITLVIYAAIALRAIAVGRSLALGGRAAFSFPGAGLTVLIQVIVVTLVFVTWDRLAARRRKNWRVTPSIAEPPSQRLLAVGAAVFALLAAWWAAIPYAPMLLLGPAANYIELTSAWRLFHAPVLSLLFLGAVHRVVLLARSHWTFAQPAIRCAINGAGLLALYAIIASYPLFAVIGGSSAPPDEVRIARYLNAPTLLWWFWPYLAINALAAGVICIRQLRRRASGRTSTTPS